MRQATNSSQAEGTNVNESATTLNFYVTQKGGGSASRRRYTHTHSHKKHTRAADKKKKTRNSIRSYRVYVAAFSTTIQQANTNYTIVFERPSLGKEKSSAQSKRETLHQSNVRRQPRGASRVTLLETLTNKLGPWMMLASVISLSPCCVQQLQMMDDDYLFSDLQRYHQMKTKRTKSAH